MVKLKEKGVIYEMKKILKNILDWLEPKVNYADLRFVQTEKESICLLYTSPSPRD